MKQAAVYRKRNECGATIVEVALLVTLLIVVGVASVQSHGKSLNDNYASAAEALRVQPRQYGGGTVSGLNARGGGTAQGDANRPDGDPPRRTTANNGNDFRRTNNTREIPGGGGGI